MSAQTNIEWCDSTFNAWRVCTPTGPGCDHCYAAALSKRTGGPAYEQGVPRVRTSALNWKIPRTWNRQVFWECAECGHRGEDKRGGDLSRRPVECPACGKNALKLARRRVFCLSLGDWLDKEVSIAWLVDLLDLIRETPNLEWLLLTKRIGMWRNRLDLAGGFARDTGRPELAKWIGGWLYGAPPDHVTIGITVVNQPEYDRDIGKVLRTPAARRFLSIEPMLGAIDMRMGGASLPDYSEQRPLPRIDWVICGGESGPKARPMHPDWARSLRDQCAAAVVPYLFKQWGEWTEVDSGMAEPLVAREGDPEFDTELAKHAGFISLAGHFVTDPDDMVEGVPYRGLIRPGKKAAGRLLDGVEHNGFPRNNP